MEWRLVSESAGCLRCGAGLGNMEGETDGALPSWQGSGAPLSAACLGGNPVCA